MNLRLPCTDSECSNTRECSVTLTGNCWCTIYAIQDHFLMENICNSLALFCDTTMSFLPMVHWHALMTLILFCWPQDAWLNHIWDSVPIPATPMMHSWFVFLNLIRSWQHPKYVPGNHFDNDHKAEYYLFSFWNINLELLVSNSLCKWKVWINRSGMLPYLIFFPFYLSNTCKWFRGNCIFSNLE